MFRVMAGIAIKAPHARVNLLFKDGCHARLMRPDVHDNILLAASTANVVVRSLK